MNIWEKILNILTPTHVKMRKRIHLIREDHDNRMKLIDAARESIDALTRAPNCLEVSQEQRLLINTHGFDAKIHCFDLPFTGFTHKCYVAEFHSESDQALFMMGR